MPLSRVPGDPLDHLCFTTTHELLTAPQTTAWDCAACASPLSSTSDVLAGRVHSHQSRLGVSKSDHSRGHGPNMVDLRWCLRNKRLSDHDLRATQGHGSWLQRTCHSTSPLWVVARWPREMPRLGRLFRLYEHRLDLLLKPVAHTRLPIVIQLLKFAHPPSGGSARIGRSRGHFFRSRCGSYGRIWAPFAELLANLGRRLDRERGESVGRTVFGNRFGGSSGPVLPMIIVSVAVREEEGHDQDQAKHWAKLNESKCIECFVWSQQ
jgi:hypothetical protein